METNELIKQAYKIASKKLKVMYINAEEIMDLTDNSMTMCLTIYYLKKGMNKNFTVRIYSFQDEYNCESLLRELKHELKRL